MIRARSAIARSVALSGGKVRAAAPQWARQAPSGRRGRDGAGGSAIAPVSSRARSLADCACGADSPTIEADRERDRNGDECGENRHGLSVANGWVVEASDGATASGAPLHLGAEHYRANANGDVGPGRGRLLESNVHLPQSPMSDPVDRPLPPTSGEPDAPEVAGSAARAESERVAAEADAPRPKSRGFDRRC